MQNIDRFRSKYPELNDETIEQFEKDKAFNNLEDELYNFYKGYINKEATTSSWRRLFHRHLQTKGMNLTRVYELEFIYFSLKCSNIRWKDCNCGGYGKFEVEDEYIHVVE